MKYLNNTSYEMPDTKEEGLIEDALLRSIDGNVNKMLKSLKICEMAGDESDYEDIIKTRKNQIRRQSEKLRQSVDDLVRHCPPTSSEKTINLSDEQTYLLSRLYDHVDVVKEDNTPENIDKLRQCIEKAVEIFCSEFRPKATEPWKPERYDILDGDDPGKSKPCLTKGTSLILLDFKFELPPPVPQHPVWKQLVIPDIPEEHFAANAEVRSD